MYDCVLTYGSDIFLAVFPVTSCPGFPVLGRPSPGFCVSFLRLLNRGPIPFIPLTPFVGGTLGGCLNPEGGRLELSEGEGED